MTHTIEKDDKWHKMSDVTETTTDVLFKKKDGTIVQGEIVVEMSGYYYYQRGEENGWLSVDDISEWKFR